MKESFIEYKPQLASLELIHEINRIINRYLEQGFTLSVRQIYYQLVTTNTIKNSDASYNRLVGLLTKAREGGFVRWDAIVDRGRPLRGVNFETSPANAMKYLAKKYKLNKNQTQNEHIEVWFEKDALLGVVGQVCQELNVDYMSCRGFPSISVLWRAVHRFPQGKTPIILALADHDPSGFGITESIAKKLELYGAYDAEVIRVALNMEQIENYNPPPNPTKLSDSRAAGYVEKYGASSWELDALPPEVLSEIITDNVMAYRNQDKWDFIASQEQKHKQALEEIARRL